MSKKPAPPAPATGDDDTFDAEQAHLAIARAAEIKPHLARAREKLNKLAGDDDRGIQMLAEAIRRMMRQE